MSMRIIQRLRTFRKRCATANTVPAALSIAPPKEEGFQFVGGKLGHLEPHVRDEVIALKQSDLKEFNGTLVAPSGKSKEL